MNQDEVWMNRALELAEKGRGRVSPNPLVGALVVRNGKSVGEGYHAYFGGPHAEVVALRKAGNRAKGGTLYVTLEPCSTWGKTPPCVDQVLKSRVRRVVVGVQDPNPLNHNKGILQLRRAGLKIQTGVLSKKAEEQNAPFFKAMRTGFPYVTLKMAQSLDGKIATPQGKSRWITSKKSREFVHQLRADADAVLVGKNTALQDNPRLQAGNGRTKPWRVVLDPDLELPSGARIFTGVQPTLVALREKNLKKIHRTDQKKGRIFIPVAEKKGKLDLDILLRRLVLLGVNHLLVEGGGELAWSFLSEKKVDRLVWIVAPKIIGGRSAKTSVEGEGIHHLEKAFPLQWKQVYPLGDDWVLEACLRES